MQLFTQKGKAIDKLPPTQAVNILFEPSEDVNAIGSCGLNQFISHSNMSLNPLGTIEYLRNDVLYFIVTLTTKYCKTGLGCTNNFISKTFQY